MTTMFRPGRRAAGRAPPRCWHRGYRPTPPTLRLWPVGPNRAVACRQTAASLTGQIETCKRPHRSAAPRSRLSSAGLLGTHCPSQIFGGRDGTLACRDLYRAGSDDKAVLALLLQLAAGCVGVGLRQPNQRRTEQHTITPLGTADADRGAAKQIGGATHGDLQRGSGLLRLLEGADLHTVRLSELGLPLLGCRLTLGRLLGRLRFAWPHGGTLDFRPFGRTEGIATDLAVMAGSRTRDNDVVRPGQPRHGGRRDQSFARGRGWSGLRWRLTPPASGLGEAVVEQSHHAASRAPAWGRR